MYLEKDLRQLKYTMQKNHMHKHMSKCLDKYAAKRILIQRMLKGGWNGWMGSKPTNVQL